ncbi:hypothetical protein [Streptomyces sp. NBC_01235]|uniref:hypothetical protein n=1 Tax=Streptomyces sp. NBC_01235 TaxID=2903788 RepID=UPI002E16006E|nr:hypothetical protein OG289_20335 [Streptomyces sp. NBC_01235]
MSAERVVRQILSDEAPDTAARRGDGDTESGGDGSDGAVIGIPRPVDRSARLPEYT